MTSTKNCDVIVTYCWNRVGYNIIRSLFEKGLNVVVGDTSRHNICCMSRYCVGSFIYSDPTIDEQAFISDIKAAIEKYGAKVLMPTHDEALVLAKHIEELPRDVVYCMEDSEMQVKLSDKYSATILAQKAGVPVPAFIQNLERHIYPIVIKTKFGNSAKGVYFPKSYGEAMKIISNYKSEDLLIEEFFPGVDYSVDCVRYNDFFFASSYRSLVTKTNGGGTTTQRVIVSMPKIERYAEQLLNEVDYKGVCGIDFKVNEETGEAVFIEVNARFTGGLATPMTAGFDIPYVVYSLFTRGKYEHPINLKIGTKTKWILGDVIALVSKIVQRTLTKEEFKQIISWKFDAFDDFRHDDKKAIIGECRYYLTKLIKNKKLNP